MKIKVEKTGPCRRTMAVELPVEKVDAEYAAVSGEFAKAAAIPGYRKGRAPQALVERHFAREIEADVRDRLIYSSYREALKQKEIDPVAVLDVQDVNLGRGQPLTYKVILDMPPEFKLPKYKGLALKGDKIEVTEAEVQRSLDELLDRFASTVAVVGRPAGNGDVVKIDYDGASDGRPLADLVKDDPRLSRNRNYWMVIGSKSFLPEIEAGLVGMSVGEQKEIQVAFPADFGAKAVAGKQAVYRVYLREIREKKLPAVDENFLKQVESASEADLRAKLRESLLKAAEYREKQRLKDEIAKLLLGKTDIEVPDSIVQDETQRVLASIVRRNLMRGVTKEQMAGQREQLLSEASRSAADSVKLSYILHRIAEDEKISVADAEVEEEIKLLARRYQVTPDVLRKQLEEKHELESMRHGRRMEKTMDFMLASTKMGEEGFFNRIFGGGAKSAPGA